MVPPTRSLEDHAFIPLNSSEHSEYSKVSVRNSTKAGQCLLWAPSSPLPVVCTFWERSFCPRPTVLLTLWSWLPGPRQRGPTVESPSKGQSGPLSQGELRQYVTLTVWGTHVPPCRQSEQVVYGKRGGWNSQAARAENKMEGALFSF